MSYARRPRHARPGPADADPGDSYRKRRRRRAIAAAASRPGGPTLRQVAHPEALIAAYDALAASGGRAPGPDGLTYADLGRGEACAVLRALSAAILRGEYSPSAGRKLPIPKPGGGTRTLTIVNIFDRVVAAAVARALTPLFERAFLGCSFGFRPGRGTWDLLAELMATMAALRITTLAIDDVRRAFDHVPIAPLLEIFKEHLEDPSLLQLVETILRGGEDRGRVVGIPQGSPLSPLALNVYLHHVHDRPLQGDPDFPPPFRYADNVCYPCKDVPEGIDALDHVRLILAPTGLALKGLDGDPIDLIEGGEARLLGFSLSIKGAGFSLGLGEDALGADMDRRLIEAHDDPDPHRAARTALRGWVAACGPALGEPTEGDTEAILRTAARHGFRELASKEELAGWCTAAHGRWEARLAAALMAHGMADEDSLCVEAPPATTEPVD